MPKKRRAGQQAGKEPEHVFRAERVGARRDAVEHQPRADAVAAEVLPVHLFGHLLDFDGAGVEPDVEHLAVDCAVQHGDSSSFICSCGRRETTARYASRGGFSAGDREYRAALRYARYVGASITTGASGARQVNPSVNVKGTAYSHTLCLSVPFRSRRPRRRSSGTERAETNCASSAAIRAGAPLFPGRSVPYCSSDDVRLVHRERPRPAVFVCDQRTAGAEVQGLCPVCDRHRRARRRARG